MIANKWQANAIFRFNQLSLLRSSILLHVIYTNVRKNLPSIVVYIHHSQLPNASIALNFFHKILE